jgi:hypothetical protein
MLLGQPLRRWAAQPPGGRSDLLHDGATPNGHFTQLGACYGSKATPEARQKSGSRGWPTHLFFDAMNDAA